MILTTDGKSFGPTKVGVVGLAPPTLTMALSCQNRIFMAQFYKQCFPKIARKVQDYAEIRAMCCF